jgi:integrase
MNNKPIRAKWPRVIRVSSHGAERFMVDSRRIGFAQGGRTFHECQAEALATAEQLERIMKNEGARGFADLSPEQRGDAAEAIAILAEYDVTLVTSARAYVAALKIERGRSIGPTVTEALAGYLKAKEAETERAELSRYTYWELCSKGNKIRDYFGEKRISEIDHAGIGEFLAQLHLKPRGKANVLLKLGQFLNWAVGQKMIAANPATGINVKVPKREVEILTVKEAKALLRAAEESEHAANVVPYLAVSLFAGLRPFEAQQLRYEQIDFRTRQIKVLAQTSKTRETRFVEIEPLLMDWLKPYRKNTGQIVGPGFRKDWDTVRRSAGITSWPVDVLRHMFGSHWLAVHKNRADLAERMGNSVQIIKRNYRRAIPKQIAEQYWKLRPKASGPKPAKSEVIIKFPTESDKVVAAR